MVAAAQVVPARASRAAPQPVRWAAGHGLTRVVLRRAARRGDLSAQIAMDPVLRREPFEAYARLRAQGELVRGRLVDATASHAVASAVLRDVEHFGVDVQAAMPSPLGRRLLRLSLDPRAVGPVEPPSMLAVDPPDHTRFRRLVAKVFTARSVAALAPGVEEVAARLVEQALRAPGGRVDLVEAYAAQLPVTVICDLLGVPADVRGRFLAWGEAAALTLDPGLSLAQHRRAARALRDMHAWLDGHLERLRRDPGPDLLSQLVGLVDEGERLTHAELRITALLVIAAGFETTVNLLGSGVVRLVGDDAQRDLLLSGRAGWDGAVEELLRLESPVQVTSRVVRAPVELCGRTLPRGRLLLVMLGGANRDPRVFDDPDRLDVQRPNAREHLAFSAGTHFCLGAALARLEGTVGLRVLLEACPDLALDGEPVRRPLRVLRGHERLPVRLR